MYSDILNGIGYEIFYSLGVPYSFICRFTNDLLPVLLAVIGVHLGIRIFKYFLNL